MINGLLPLLQWLDRRLEEAIASTDDDNKSASDTYRGLLQIESETAEKLLEREPGIPQFSGLETDNLLVQILPDSPLDWLQKTYQLSEFEIKIMAIALAPELDRRYEKLYAYLQDDVRCKRPTVDLALNLLSNSAAEKLSQRAYFATNATLITHQLLHLISESNRPTLIARELHLDEQVIQLLLGQPGIDSRLINYCQLIEPNKIIDDFSLPAEMPPGLMALTRQHWQQQQPLQLYFQGTDVSIKQSTAQTLASKAQTNLIIANLLKLNTSKNDFELNLNLILREAKFRQTWLYLEDLDALMTEEQRLVYQTLLAALANLEGIIILSGEQPWHPEKAILSSFITISFPPLNFEQRRNCWQSHLASMGMNLNEQDLDYLSDRFLLQPTQIANAVAIAANTKHWKTFSNKDQNIPQTEDLQLLFTAARSQSGRDLTNLARKIEPKYQWQDIVLPPNQTSQLREICNQAKHHHLVWETWGFGERLSLGKGLNVLFSGLPGTGKTMAAEVIARELQLDLYKIDLSQMVSKYIGETEKNLNRVFNAAANSNAILLFDEADAIFGKRSEVQDAHDRYANIETSYLLQKMEEYQGIAILTTNFRSNIDEAFMRRLRFTIEFPLPDISERHQIWQQIWPHHTPRSPDLDLEFLAKKFQLSGANIRNIALRASFLAADDGGMVNMEHLIYAIRQDYDQRGKILMREELGQYGKFG